MQIYSFAEKSMCPSRIFPSKFLVHVSGRQSNNFLQYKRCFLCNIERFTLNKENMPLKPSEHAGSQAGWWPHKFRWKLFPIPFKLICGHNIVLSMQIRERFTLYYLLSFKFAHYWVITNPIHVFLLSQFVFVLQWWIWCVKRKVFSGIVKEKPRKSKCKAP